MLGSTGIPCSARRTGIWVRLDNSSTIRLLCCGDRCWTTTKLMPLSGGMLSKKESSASSPPAEAPMPTQCLGPPLASPPSFSSGSSVETDWLMGTTLRVQRAGEVERTWVRENRERAVRHVAGRCPLDRLASFRTPEDAPLPPPPGGPQPAPPAAPHRDDCAERLRVYLTFLTVSRALLEMSTGMPRKTRDYRGSGLTGPVPG